MSRYPKLVLYPDRIRENASRVVEFCAAANVEVAAVTKGVCADPKIAQAMVEGGCSSFADSRLRNLTSLKKAFPDVSRTLLRIPMKSELDDVVRVADCSLVSMPESVEALENRCRALNCTHGVILMFDLGDRREGILDKTDDEVQIFIDILKKTPRVALRGVGVNFGCFAGILPSGIALHRLCLAREKLQEALGYKIPVCSGGSTSSLMLIERGELPSGVSQLRVGEAILLGLDVTWQRRIPWLRQDTAFLEAEVVESRLKPSLPEGDIGADAFGKVQSFEDRGLRHRVIVAVGRQDVPMEGISPLGKGIELLGGSSDHTLLDVSEANDLGTPPPAWGDILAFSLNYAGLLGLSTSPYVAREYR